MARSKKRQKRQKSKSGPGEKGSAPRAHVDEHRLTSGCETEMQRTDLLQKLPGELRNKIYELVLIKTRTKGKGYDGYPTRHSKGKKVQIWSDEEEPATPVEYETEQVLNGIGFRRWQNWQHYHERYMRWGEPGLLMAAKWIRQEVLLMYFGPVDLSVTSESIGPACVWLSAVGATLGVEWLHNIEFRLSSGEWEDLETWLPVAQLYCDHGSGLQVVGYDRKYAQVRGEHRHIAHALHEVIKLGLKAREQSWSKDYLAIQFEEWKDTKIYDSIPVRQRQLAPKLSQFGRKLKEVEDADGWEASPTNAFRYHGSALRKLEPLQTRLRKRKTSSTQEDSEED